MHNYACIPSQGKFILPCFENALEMLDFFQRELNSPWWGIGKGENWIGNQNWRPAGRPHSINLIKLNCAYMNICCFIILTIIQIDLSSLTIIVSSLPPFGWSQMETKNFEILLTRKKKVSVRGWAIWMIYVAIRKVICSLDLAASSLHGWQNNFKTRCTTFFLQTFFFYVLTFLIHDFSFFSRLHILFENTILNLDFLAIHF